MKNRINYSFEYIMKNLYKYSEFLSEYSWCGAVGIKISSFD